MKKIRSLNMIIILAATLGFITHCNAENETGLRVVRGTIANYAHFANGAGPASPVIVSGGGFTVSGGNDRDRRINITFKEPFKDNPAITVTSNIYGDSYGKGRGAWAQMCYIWNDHNGPGPINGNYKNNFAVRCKSDVHGDMATQISFIAIGK